MKYLFLAVSSFLAIIAQMIAGNSFFLFNFLDLSLILIAYWSLYRDRTQALFVGSFTGLLLDAVLGWPLGYNGFSKTLAAFLAGIDFCLSLPPDAVSGVRVLYISPLKALVYDVERNLRAPLVGIRHQASALEHGVRDVGVAVRTGDVVVPDGTNPLSTLSA